ncbi:MAG: hypothetical protein M3N53_00030 [Actinomycetota bacterium]|nr:hypothetical protein [Actinomycetota bacterium]
MLPSGDSRIAPLFQHEPATAWNPQGGLVVWEDERWHRFTYEMPQIPQTSDSARNIYATFLNNDGSPRGRLSFPITTQPGADSQPDIAASEHGFYVTWVHTGKDGDVLKGTFVSNTGRVTDEHHTFSTPGQYPPVGSVASDGQNFVVVWNDRPLNATSSPLRSQFVDPQGRASAEPKVIPADSDPEGVLDPEISFGRDKYLVTYKDYGGPVYVLLSLDGTPRGDLHRLSPNDRSGTPDHAFMDGAWMVIWRESHFDNGYETDPLLGVRVDPDGRQLDAEPTVLVADLRITPVMTAGDGCFVVAWDAYSEGTGADVRAIRFTSEGRPMDSEPLIISEAPEDQVELALATGPRGVHAVYSSSERRRSGSYRSVLETDIYGSGLSCTGAVDTPRPLSFTPVPHGTAQVIQGDGQRLVIWFHHENSSAAYRSTWGETLMAGRFTEAGRPLDGNGFRLASTNGDMIGDVAGAWNGRRYMVTWFERASSDTALGLAKATPLTSKGTVVAPGGETIRRYGSGPVGVTGTRGGFVTAWPHSENLQMDIHGQRLSDDAEPRGRFFPLASTGTDDYFGGFAQWGRRQIMSFFSVEPPGSYSVATPEVSLQVFDAKGRKGKRIRVGSGGITNVANMAPKKVVVAWLVGGGDVKVRSLLRDGELTRVKTLRRAFDRPERFTQVGDEALPLTITATKRAAFLLLPKESAQGDIDLSLIRIGRRVGKPRTVTAHFSDELYYDVSPVRNGRAMVTYQRAGVERNYGGVSRVFYRVLSPD